MKKETMMMGEIEDKNKKEKKEGGKVKGETSSTRA